ncbi:hypothetical protein PLICRDRAFT_180049 [Plicaturopsis crispa FD-325 SS-3]|uniref:Tetratricopeptide repeat protein 39B n=1 Tax=Plicaturopsis crispa FD-325 SS-3 TaxID=944288 RepID=A0A0C9SQF5_PLICR|nr:hypothetical protein PLICRDRAFT_180049 [Plicaturopsis crispa FD-325 SS-3]
MSSLVVPQGSSTPSDTSAGTAPDSASVVDNFLTPPTTRPATPEKVLTPPPVERPYDAKNALVDLPCVAYALETFLASHMLEAEDYMNEKDPSKERLYFATGFGLIQCVKGLMSFENEDLLAGIGHTKHGNHIASLHRKRAASLPMRLAGYFAGSLHASGIGFVQSMTAVERHAELVYAESLFEKALLGIVYSGDFLAFIKEALNMRTTINIYRQLYKFIEHSDEEATARGEGQEDVSIDAHFRSGVYLGIGLSNLILSLIPSKILTIMEIFGYKGDRKFGLEILARAGGWSKDRDEPTVTRENEGVRRSICDMSLLIFHLVLSSLTFDGVDMSMAQKILDYNLKRYPNGVFFLFGAGRLCLARGQPKKAIEYYTKAMESQSQYRNLHHISFWEMAISHMALWDISSSLPCWRNLEAESTWSKAIYSYGVAVCLLELGGEANKEEAKKFMDKVPGLRQRIAGKSIPLEKFVARKARKFHEQGGRLAMPGLEILYLFLGIARAPRTIVLTKMVPEVERHLAVLRAHEADPASYEGGTGFWDDMCLARFLEGVCYRYVAYPDPDAILDPDERLAVPREDAVKRATDAFKFVFAHGPEIHFEHYLVYHAHYEYGRLLACEGDHEGARTQLDLVLSGKPLEVNHAARKGKYSMESALHVRAHAALEAIHQKRL